MTSKKNHFIIRVSDGVNFRNSKFNLWGMKKGYDTFIKNIGMKEGDVLWFLTSKNYGGKIIGMAEYHNCYNRKDEPLFLMNTKSNEEMGWDKDEKWDIQIEYKNLYNTEKQEITGVIQGHSNIFPYEKYKDNFKNHDLYQEYENFKRYAEPINKN